MIDSGDAFRGNIVFEGEQALPFAEYHRVITLYIQHEITVERETLNGLNDSKSWLGD